MGAGAETRHCVHWMSASAGKELETGSRSSEGDGASWEVQAGGCRLAGRCMPMRGGPGVASSAGGARW